MIEKIFIKPAKPDLLVRHPDTLKLLKPEGEYVVKTPQWLRYLRTGDVVFCVAPDAVVRVGGVEIKEKDKKVTKEEKL